jgi:hypothetical protein
MSAYDLSLAHSIEVFSLDNEDDDDVMHDFAAGKVREALGFAQHHGRLRLGQALARRRPRTAPSF